MTSTTIQMNEVAVDGALGGTRGSAKVLEDMDTLQLMPKSDLIKRFESAGRGFDAEVINSIYKVRTFLCLLLPAP